MQITFMPSITPVVWYLLSPWPPPALPDCLALVLLLMPITLEESLDELWSESVSNFDLSTIA